LAICVASIAYRAALAAADRALRAAPSRPCSPTRLLTWLRPLERRPPPAGLAVLQRAPGHSERRVGRPTSLSRPTSRPARRRLPPSPCPATVALA